MAETTAYCGGECAKDDSNKWRSIPWTDSGDTAGVLVRGEGARGQQLWRDRRLRSPLAKKGEKEKGEKRGEREDLCFESQNIGVETPLKAMIYSPVLSALLVIVASIIFELKNIDVRHIGGKRLELTAWTAGRRRGSTNAAGREGGLVTSADDDGRRDVRTDTASRGWPARRGRLDAARKSGRRRGGAVNHKRQRARMAWCDDVTPARLDGGVVREENKREKKKRNED
ncbi:hypothetical protein Scep_026596 [Stephania cephalantha]|uniref:Uncharacterized protein n=1 Tax=Stephania cephalantha TaxID=152367 RepID=A0AAP0HS69_9MAGN